MLFREALNQFQHKPNVPFCILCGNKGSEDGRHCDDCSSCPTTDKKQNFLVLYSKQIDFIMELDLYHSTVTSTEISKDKIFPIKADPPRNFLKEDESVFQQHFFGLLGVDPLYNLVNKFRKLNYSVVLLQNTHNVPSKYRPLMENWMRTSDYRAALSLSVVHASSVIAAATSLCNLQESFPGAPAALEGPYEHVGDGAAAEDAAKDAAPAKDQVPVPQCITGRILEIIKSHYR